MTFQKLDSEFPKVSLFLPIWPELIWGNQVTHWYNPYSSLISSPNYTSHYFLFSCFLRKLFLKKQKTKNNCKNSNSLRACLKTRQLLVSLPSLVSATLSDMQWEAGVVKHSPWHFRRFLTPGPWVIPMLLSPACLAPLKMSRRGSLALWTFMVLLQLALVPSQLAGYRLNPCLEVRDL